MINREWDGVGFRPHIGIPYSSAPADFCLTKYIPDVSRALYGMMTAMADESLPQAQGRTRRPRDPEQDELLEQVRNKKLKEDTLSSKARAVPLSTRAAHRS